jgi:aquaporin NIP
MKKYCAEIMGTFALVFAGTGAVVIDDITGGTITHVGIALTFGLIVMAAIYAIGDISGAHLNPAVTTGFFLAGKLPGREVIPYIASQLAGAFLASLILLMLFGNHAHLGATLPRGSALQSFGLEVILTWLLMFVILCVSSGPKEVGIMAGAAIGGVIALEALFGGPISGASMNPARSIAPAIVSHTLTSLWVYIAGPVLGAALSIPCWRIIQKEKP